MNRLVELTMKNRGYTEDYLRDINDSSHDILKDADKLCSCLKYIHDSGMKLTVYPDFDMDGIASGTLGFAGFAELGFNVSLFVPDASKGYGISVESIKTLMNRFPDTQAIITCDTGIDAAAAADYCKSINVIFLVTDHHMQDRMISADIIVNPFRVDETYAHPKICGAHVLYQILMRYAELYGNYYIQSQIERLKVFAGIGTVSDVMPVLYENRQLVRDAVSICRLIYGDGTSGFVATVPGCDVYRRAFWGLYYVLSVYHDCGSINSQDDITEEFFGFYLAPMFNSCKRLSEDMTKAFGVFFGNNPHDDASHLYDLNLKRKELTERELNTMLSQSQPYAPYVYISTANEGILGLLATKFISRSGKPTLVVRLDNGYYHGSGRKPDWYVFDERDAQLIHRKGHASSFGCGFNSENDIKAFFDSVGATYDAQYMDAVDSGLIVEDAYDFVIAPDWSADTGIDISLFAEYIDEINAFRPFGKDFPAPRIKFTFFNRDVIGWKQIGKTKQHLKISFANGFDMLCWNQGHLISEQNNDVQHVVYGHLGRSEFRGEESVNFTGDFAI